MADRIFKREQLKKDDVKIMNEALDSFYEKHYGKGVQERIEAERKANPNIIEVNGKFYDKRYYKGVI